MDADAEPSNQERVNRRMGINTVLCDLQQQVNSR